MTSKNKKVPWGFVTKQLKEALRAAKNKIATLYREEKTKCNNNGEKLPKGWLNL